MMMVVSFFLTNSKKFYVNMGFISNSCPNTSQQNGLPKRKHRHIMEVGLSLLAQSHLPTKFLVKMFMTAIYLINHTLTYILDYISPYFKLFAQTPDYSFLRMFGCVCYSLLRPYKKHKLAFCCKYYIFFLTICLNIMDITA